jgi:hypothetical protein
MRAAKTAGHTGKGIARAPGNRPRSTFGSAAPVRARSVSPVVARHHDPDRLPSRTRLRPAGVAYLQRDGGTHDGADAHVFDARSDPADERDFAACCEGETWRGFASDRSRET